MLFRMLRLKGWWMLLSDLHQAYIPAKYLSGSVSEVARPRCVQGVSASV